MCSADGKIRLATLELSCLLLKQQVVTSTGCIIKDVHLACLEVRVLSTPSTGEPLPPGRIRGIPGLWCPQHQQEEAGPNSPDAHYILLVPTELPFHWNWLDEPA